MTKYLQGNRFDSGILQTSDYRSSMDEDADLNLHRLRARCHEASIQAKAIEPANYEMRFRCEGIAGPIPLLHQGHGILLVTRNAIASLVSIQLAFWSVRDFSGFSPVIVQPLPGFYCHSPVLGGRRPRAPTVLSPYSLPDLYLQRLRRRSPKLDIYMSNAATIVLYCDHLRYDLHRQRAHVLRGRSESCRVVG